MAPLSLRAAQRLSGVSSASMASTASTASIRPTSAAAFSCRCLRQVRGYKQASLPSGQIPIPSATAQQPEIPPYPLGPRQVYKQSNTGLYGNVRIRFGNTVSRETAIINPQKNRRKFRPNIQEKRLWSVALGAHIRTRISTRVLRTIDKVGGLDEYLLGSKSARIAELGPWGWRLRWRVMQTPAVQERFRQERIALGLPAEGLPTEVATEAAEELSGAAEAVADPNTAAQTQSMIDGDEIFDLAPEDDGFMREEKGSK